jgi:hypothetical protein
LIIVGISTTTKAIAILYAAMVNEAASCWAYRTKIAPVDTDNTPAANAM